MIRNLSRARPSLVAAAAAIVLVACPSVAIGATAATPVTGSVFGPITSLSGNTFKLKTPLSPTGTASISVGSATVITEQVAATRSSLRPGVCVAAFGTRDSKGVVAATRIMISAPVKGRCDAGFGARRGTRTGGPPPGSGQRPPGGFGGGANLGFAFGGVSAVKGTTLTVHGRRGTTTVTTTVTVSAKTTLVETMRVGASAIEVKSCAFVRGTSSDKGVTVTAESISLTKQTNGACTTGFRRR
jgi:hypothetical protein